MKEIFTLRRIVNEIDRLVAKEKKREREEERSTRNLRYFNTFNKFPPSPFFAPVLFSLLLYTFERNKSPLITLWRIVKRREGERKRKGKGRITLSLVLPFARTFFFISSSESLNRGQLWFRVVTLGDW